MQNDFAMTVNQCEPMNEDIENGFTLCDKVPKGKGLDLKNRYSTLGLKFLNNI